MLFGDTVYFLALLNSADQYHRQAVASSRQLSQPLVTTEFVLTEVGDALRNPANRGRFSRLLALLRNQPDVLVVPASAELFARGCALYDARHDKAWSLTDCISFVVMSEHRIADALTSDHHFEQAGFRPLLA